MGKIILGIIIVLIGVNTAGSDSEFVWVGAWIAGPMLIVIGYKERRKKKMLEKAFELLENRKEQIWKDLESGRSIDSVANQLYMNLQVPVMLTYKYCADYLKTLLESDEKQARAILRQQVLDSSPEDSVLKLGTTVLKYDDTALYISTNGKPTKGLLLLSRGSLLFFPENSSIGYKLIKGLWDKLYELPFLGLILWVFDLAFLLKAEIQGPLPAGKVKRLAERMSEGYCKTIAISRIQGFETTERKLSWLNTAACLMVRSDDQELCFSTSRGSKDKWIEETISQLKVIAFAEGNYIQMQ